MNNYPCIDMIATGAKINRIRMERGMKVTDISTYMGFEGPRAVYRWLRAESLPSLDNMCALARLFKVTVDDLVVFAGEDEESSPVSFFVLLIQRFSDATVILYIHQNKAQDSVK